MHGHSFFCPLPEATEIAKTSVYVIFANYMLMKMGGQVSCAKADLDWLTANYRGFTLEYEHDTENYTLKLKTRLDENPPPEIPPKGTYVPA